MGREAFSPSLYLYEVTFTFFTLPDKLKSSTQLETYTPVLSEIVFCALAKGPNDISNNVRRTLGRDIKKRLFIVFGLFILQFMLKTKPFHAVA